MNMERDDKEARIYAALKGVETPEYDILAAVRAARREARRPRRGALPRAALLAACLAAALAVTALGVGAGVGWEVFFGRTPPGAVTPVAVSAVTGDYTVTLQESIVDDAGAAFLLALTRNDGGVIEGEPSLWGEVLGWGLEVDGETPGHWRGELGQGESVRAEDGRTVYACAAFTLEGAEPERLLGREITLRFDGVVDGAWSGKEQALARETVSLAPLAQAAGQADMTCEDVARRCREPELLALVEASSAQATVPLAQLGEGRSQIAAVLFTRDGPVVAVDNSPGQVRQGDYLFAPDAMAVALTDSRTGESWTYRSAARRGERNCFLSEFMGCPLTAEDLPYLEVTVAYTADKVLSDQPVALTFRADRGGGRVQALDQKVTFAYAGLRSVHVTGAKVSALRICLTADRQERLSGPGEENTPWVLLQRDGSRVPLRVSPDHFDQAGAGWIGLTAVDEAGRWRLIDPGQAEAVLVGEARIDLAG